MKVENALYPTGEAFANAMAVNDGKPVVMVNLLKFKDKAVYPDGRECSLTGAEAYDLYGREMVKFVESQGGRVLFSADVRHLMIGEVEGLWDAVALVEYPSEQEFTRIAIAPEVRAIGIHRAAGLEGQLLIAARAREGRG